MGVPLDNEGLIKYSIHVILVGTPSKLPAYHQMCATMSWFNLAEPDRFWGGGNQKWSGSARLVLVAVYRLS